jgi:hypothetical protein
MAEQWSREQLLLFPGAALTVAVTPFATPALALSALLRTPRVLAAAHLSLWLFRFSLFSCVCVLTALTQHPEDLSPAQLHVGLAFVSAGACFLGSGVSSLGLQRSCFADSLSDCSLPSQRCPQLLSNRTRSLLASAFHWLSWVVQLLLFGPSAESPSSHPIADHSDTSDDACCSGAAPAVPDHQCEDGELEPNSFSHHDSTQHSETNGGLIIRNAESALEDRSCSTPSPTLQPETPMLHNHNGLHQQHQGLARHEAGEAFMRGSCTESPYSSLSHPQYVGEALLHFGIAILCLSLHGILLSAELAIVNAFAARRETRHIRKVAERIRKGKRTVSYG